MVGQSNTQSLVTCTACGKQTTGAKAMQAHLRDSHQITGIEAHLIANPNDKVALAHHAKLARKSPPRPLDDDEFDLIDDGDF